MNKLEMLIAVSPLLISLAVFVLEKVLVLTKNTKGTERFEKYYGYFRMAFEYAEKIIPNDGIGTPESKLNISTRKLDEYLRKVNELIRGIEGENASRELLDEAKRLAAIFAEQKKAEATNASTNGDPVGTGEVSQ